ncbi:hypothetical protein Tco_0214780 [Tanacetum coccineum]
MPRQNKSCAATPVPMDNQRGLEPQWDVDQSEQIPLQVSGKVLVEVLKEKFIQEEEVATVVEEEGPTWMTSIMEYLKDETLASDRKEANKLYRGESRGNNHRQSGEEVHVRQHSMPLRSPRRNSLGQRNQSPLGRGKQELDRRTSPCPLVLSYNNKSSHSDTPFSLTYGMEAVIPTEIGMPTYRTAVVDAVHNNEELRLNLNFGRTAKVYGWNCPSADMEHRQSQEMLSLSNGMDEFAL